MAFAPARRLKALGTGLKPPGSHHSCRWWWWLFYPGCAFSCFPVAQSQDIKASPGLPSLQELLNKLQHSVSPVLIKHNKWHQDWVQRGGTLRGKPAVLKSLCRNCPLCLWSVLFLSFCTFSPPCRRTKVCMDFRVKYTCHVIAGHDTILDQGCFCLSKGNLLCKIPTGTSSGSSPASLQVQVASFSN